MYRLIGSDGKEYGPVSTEAVREWIRERRANGQTRARREGDGFWTSLGSMPEFAGDLSGPGVPPPLLSTARPQPASTATGPKTSGLAIASFVLGILGFCGVTAIVGFALGIVATFQIKRSGGRLKGTGLAVTGICLSIAMFLLLMVAAAVILPQVAKMNHQRQFQRNENFGGPVDNSSDCAKNLKQVSLAVRLYADQNSGKCPPAKTWCDDLTPFLSRPDILKCPRRSGDKSGYGLNARIAGRTLSAIPPDAVLFFETSQGWNFAGDGSNLLDKPAHGGKLTIGFADGSVREVPPEELADLRWEP